MASPGRTGSLISFFVVQCIVAVLLHFILEVPRAPLPRDEIEALVQAVGNNAEVPWLRPRIYVSGLPTTRDPFDLDDFAQKLQNELASAGVKADVLKGSAPVLLYSMKECVAPGLAGTNGANESAECQAAMEHQAASMTDTDMHGEGNEGGVDPLIATYHIMVVATESCSSIVVDVGTQAIVRWQAGGKDVEGTEKLAKALTSRLLGTWFQPLPLLSASPLFEISPSYLFSFFLVSDCKRRVAWDFHRSVLSPYLRRFTDKLHTLFDFEVDSQVVQCSSLAGSASQAASEEVDVEALKSDFLRNAGEWPGDTVTTDARWLPPLVRLAAFWPSAPLHVLDAAREPQRAFAVPGWGAVAVAGGSGCEEEACALRTSNSSDASGRHGSAPQLLSPCEAQRVASSWVSILRAWLTLRSDGPSVAASAQPCGGLPLIAAQPHHDGMARWEQLLVARVVHTLFVRRATESLQNFIALVDSLPDLELSAEIGEVVSQAAASVQQAISKAAEGNIDEALKAARLALRLSLTASHDDTVVAQMYFSWQFKWAVYLPLMLPIAVPTVVGLVREVRRARELRKAKQQVGGETVTEDVQ